MDLCGLHFQGTICHREMLRRKQELEAEILEEFCFLALSLVGSCLAGALMQRRTPCLGRVLPTVGCSFPHQIVIKTVPRWHAHRLVVLNFPNVATL